MPSVPISHLYRSLHRYLMQQIPDDCDTRLANLIYLMMGIFRAKSVQMPLIARTTPIRADKWSIVKPCVPQWGSYTLLVIDPYAPHPLIGYTIKPSCPLSTLHTPLCATMGETTSLKRLE